VDMLGLDLNLEQKTRIPLPWKLIGTLVALCLFGAFIFIGLRARTVSVEVSSEPPGAQVTVDGEKVGVTPLIVESRRSRRPKIAIEAPEREPYGTQLVFPLLGEIKPLNVELPLASATLQLRSNPAGALVTLDSGAACRTPCALSSLPPRTKHLVAVSREGCAPATFVFEAEPEETLERESHLTPLQLGTLSLIRVLADERPILLDGEDVSAIASRGAFFIFGGEHLLQLGRGNSRREQVVKLPSSQVAWLDLRAEAEPPPAPVSIAEDEYKRRGASSPVSEQLDYAAYLASQGQAGKASAYLTKALKRDPGDPHALRLGIAFALTRTDAARAKIHASVFIALPKLPDDVFRVQRALEAARGETSCGVDTK